MKKNKVLIVEDEEDIASILKLNLEADGLLCSISKIHLTSVRSKCRKGWLGKKRAEEGLYIFPLMTESQTWSYR